MTFEDFLKKLDGEVEPDRAYKLYLQVKLSIVKALLLKSSGLSESDWDKIENETLSEVVSMLKK